MSKLASALTTLLAPQQNACHLCGTLLFMGEQTLCQDCWQRLTLCAVHPLEAAVHGSAPVGLCLSAFWHQNEARALLHLLKYGHDRAAAEPLAHGLCRVYATHRAKLPVIDGVAAVPIHPSRQKTRGYNQAEPLARYFCQASGLSFLPNALKREHHSASQVQRSRQQRLDAMTDAFTACCSFDGMNLLLVDDVLTTGATAAACAQCLTAAGAASVTVLTANRA